MRTITLLLPLLLACAETSPRAPGEPTGDELVATYYYLNF